MKNVKCVDLRKSGLKNMDLRVFWFWKKGKRRNSEKNEEWRAMERGILVRYIAIYREESVTDVTKIKIMERESEKLKVRKEFQWIMDEFKRK